MKILIVDSYDSFTYNIAHVIKKLGYTDICVALNDRLELDSVADYDKIILSPGPGIPSRAGILLPLLREYASRKSILGICLGEQAIGESFGATLTNLTDVFHGVATEVEVVADEPLFKGIPTKFEAGRYHSWIVSHDNFPHQALKVTARDCHGNIMALAHNRSDVRGVQFHPESILTPQGEDMISNWLKM